LVFTVKAIFNSLVDRTGEFSEFGEVHFSRRTYSPAIDELESGFNKEQRTQAAPSRQVKGNKTAKLFNGMDIKKTEKKGPHGPLNSDQTETNVGVFSNLPATGKYQISTNSTSSQSATPNQS
jgi:hypothetical protein